MGKKDANKPKGRMSAYVYFVQTCREEEKKKNPGGTVGFAEFSKECSEKWKVIGAKEKKRFDDMAAKDKARYEKEMANYVPSGDAGSGNKRKAKKDPNAPKRPLSAFFVFSNEHRAAIKKANPDFGIGDVAKALGKKWEAQKDRSKYEATAAKDKERYEKEMASYKKGGASSPKKSKPTPKSKKQVVEEEEDDDEEEEEDDDDEDEEEEEESDE